MLVNLCTKCQNKLAISPDGLCNICDEEALQKRQTRKVAIVGHSNTEAKHAAIQRVLAEHRTGIVIPRKTSKK